MRTSVPDKQLRERLLDAGELDVEAFDQTGCITDLRGTATSFHLTAHGS
jgi:hypothetical protein